MSAPKKVVLVDVSHRQNLAIWNYEEDKAVIRRLRAWLKKNPLDPPSAFAEDHGREMLLDLTAFLRDEKAKIGGGK